MNAGTHALAGKVAEGLVLIDDALELVGSGDPTAIPELFLLKGDLLSAAGAADADAAYWFHRAFDSAASAGVRMTQLRAASDCAVSGRARVRTMPTGCYAVCTTPSPRASRSRTWPKPGPFSRVDHLN